MAQDWLIANNYEKALEAINIAENIAPNNVYVLSIKATCLFRLNKYEEAEIYARKKLKLQKNVTSYDILVKILMKQRKYQEALDVLENTSIKMQDHTLLSRYIELLTFVGELEKSLLFSEKCFQKFPERDPLKQHLKILMFNSQNERAEELIRQKRNWELLGDTAPGFLMEALRKQRRYAEVIGIGTQVKRPTYKVFINLAYSYMHLQDFDTAFEFLQKAQKSKYLEITVFDYELRTACGFIFLLEKIVAAKANIQFMDELKDKVTQAIKKIEAHKDIILPNQEQDIRCALEIIEALQQHQ